MKNSKVKFMCFSVAALLFVSVIKTNAQKGEFGFRVMPTFSSFSANSYGGGTVSGTVTLGWGFGALLGFNFSEHVGVQGEIIYTTMAQKYKMADVEREVNLRYFNIPLLLTLNTGKTKPVNFSLVAGPQLGINAGGDVHVTSGDVSTETTHAIFKVKKGDLGVAYGAGIDFGLNESQTCRLGLGFRGVYGLVDISDNSESIATDSYYLLERTHIKTYSGYLGVSWLF
jgi:hypothetical protein